MKKNKIKIAAYAILFAVNAIIIAPGAIAQTNKQPITKPDTIIFPIGMLQKGMPVLMNDYDAEGDSLRCAGNALRNGTATYPLDIWLITSTCDIKLDGKGQLTVQNLKVKTPGYITTFSYLVRDGKHSTSGIVGKIVIKVVAEEPRNSELFKEAQFWAVGLCACTNLNGVKKSAVVIAGKFYFGSLNTDTLGGIFRYQGKGYYIGDPTQPLFWSSTYIPDEPFRWIIDKEDWLYMQQYACKL